MSDQTKQIQFKVGFDTQDLDKEVGKIQDKLKTMQKQMMAGSQAQSNLGGDKLLSGYAKTAFGDFSKENTDAMKKFYDEQKRSVMNDNINIRAKAQELKQLASLESKMTDDQKERVSLLKQEIDLMKTKQREQLDTLSKVKAMLPPEAQAQIGAQAQKQPGFMEKYGNVFGTVGSAITGASVLAQTLDPYVQARIERDRNLLTNRAGTNRAAQDYTQRSAQGQGSTFFYENDDRNKALVEAIKEGQSQNTKDTVMSIVRGAGGIAGGVGGAIAGGKVGALAGTVIAPGIGTLAGGILGAVGGGIMGFNAGSGSILSDSRAMNSMFDREAYKGQLTKENFGKYQQNLESNRALNTGRYMAQDYFLGNAGNFQNTQRTLGLSDRSMFGTPSLTANGPRNEGGFYQPGLQAGFSTETQNNAISGILGAGGSTAMAQNPMVSASLQRDYRLTNASNILGKISGTGSNPTESEEKTKKLLSEAFGAGLDMSKYGEETRKFLEISSSIVQASGGGGLMASIASQGLVSPSMRGVESAGTASATLNGLTSGSDASTAALQYSAMNSSGKFGELSGEIKSQLVNMSMTEIEGDANLQKYLSDRGITMDDISSMKGSGVYKTKGADDKAAKLSSYIKDKGIKSSDVYSQAQTDPELNRLLVESQAGASLSTGQSMSGMTGASFVMQQQGLVDKNFRGQAGALSANGATAADQAEASKATDQLGQLNRVSTNLGALTDSFKQNTEQSLQMVEAMKNFEAAIKAGTANLEAYQDALANLMTTQYNMRPPTASTRK